MPVKTLIPAVFSRLKQLSAPDVAALNAYSHLFGGNSSWSKWIEESLSALLMVTGGLRLELMQSSTIATTEQKNHAFTQDEILIGRETSNHIVLTENAISRRHVRIFLDGAVYKIEDLQSAAGTYLNRKRLTPGQPEKLTSSDEISIFPHALQVKVERAWHPDQGIQLSYAAGSTTTGFGIGMCKFRLQLHPTQHSAVLIFSRNFLNIIIDRLVRANSSCLTGVDLGLVEFVVFTILERANRELQFPYQFSLTAADDYYRADEPGLCLNASVRLNGSTGLLGVFFPVALLRQLEACANPQQRETLRHQLSWPVVVQAGSIHLSVSQLADLERGDVLLFEADYELLLPQKQSVSCFERGWTAEPLEEKPNAFKIKTYFERMPYMTDNPVADKPDLDALPIRMQVVIGHAELSLSELEALAEGAVIELGAEITSRVELFGNGKRLGSAELVNLDGKLGVQIYDWANG